MPFDPSRKPPPSPPLPSGALTAAMVVAIIDTWDDLPVPRRSTLRSAVRALGPALGLPLERILMDPIQLHPAMSGATAAMAGIRAGSFVTYKSSIRHILRRIELLPNNRPELTAVWQVLYDLLSDKFVRLGLGGFLVFVSERSLLPDQVSSNTLVAYRDYLLNQLRQQKPDKHVRRVARVWNAAIGNVPGWPGIRLALPAKCVRFTPPLTHYPVSFQADVQAFANRLSGENQKGLFTGDGPPTRLSPSTIQTRLKNVRQAAGALFMLGRDPASITSLSVLVEEEAFKAILDFYFERIGRKKTTHLGGIASALMIVAHYHCRLSPAQLAILRDYAKEARPKRRTMMTEKNASRLSRLDDPHTEAKLVCLPDQLMREARRFLKQGQSRQAGWTAAAAVAVKILLVCPMRSKNLVELEIDTNLVRFGHRTNRITHLRVPRHKVKNTQPIEWPIDAEISDVIQCYLTEFRPLLPYHDNAWLFPGRDRTDRHRDQIGFTQAISQAIRKHVGIEMNVHLFRAYAAKVLLEENPEAIEDLRQLLGHTGLETSIAYYVHFRGKAVARRFNATVFGKYRWAVRLLATQQRPARGAA